MCLGSSGSGPAVVWVSFLLLESGLLGQPLADSLCGCLCHGGLDLVSSMQLRPNQCPHGKLVPVLHVVLISLL